MHIQITRSSQHITFHRRHRYQVRAFGACAGHEPEELLGVAGFTEEHDDVVGGDDSDVAVESVERREKGGGDAEGDESLRDLVSDEAGFADAGEEDCAGGMEERAGEGQGLGMVDVVEEEVDVVLLGFEEGEERGFVDQRMEERLLVGKWRQRSHCFGEEMNEGSSMADLLMKKKSEKN